MFTIHVDEAECRKGARHNQERHDRPSVGDQHYDFFQKCEKSPMRSIQTRAEDGVHIWRVSLVFGHRECLLVADIWTNGVHDVLRFSHSHSLVRCGALSAVRRNAISQNLLNFVHT